MSFVFVASESVCGRFLLLLNRSLLRLACCIYVNVHIAKVFTNKNGLIEKFDRTLGTMVVYY